MRALLASLALFACALLAGASAEGCVPSTSQPEVDTDPLGATTWARNYVDVDDCAPGCGPSFWIYQESNAIDGLQRFDEAKDDTCRGLIPSDTIWS